MKYTVNSKNYGSFEFDPTGWSDEFKANLIRQGLAAIVSRCTASMKDASDAARRAEVETTVRELRDGSYSFGSGRGPSSTVEAVIAAGVIKAFLKVAGIVPKVIAEATKGTTLDEVQRNLRAAFVEPLRIKAGDKRSPDDFFAAFWDAKIKTNYEAQLAAKPQAEVDF